MRKTTGAAIFVITVVAAVIVGGDSSSNESGDLRVTADFATYRIEGDSSGAYVEVFYNIPRAQLNYSPDSSGYVAIIDFAVWLMDTTGAIIDSAAWKAGNRIESLSVLEDSDYLISDMVTEIFPRGNYNIRLSAANGEKRGLCEFAVTVPGYGSEDLNLSSLQLAYEITADSSGKFSKAGYRVLPNPSARFSQDKNVIYIYAEAYNLDISTDSSYSVLIEILDGNGQTVKTIPEANYGKPGRSAVIMTGFSYATLARGYYSVRLSVRDGDYLASSEKRFAVVASRERLRQEMLQAILKDFPESGRLESEDEAAKFRGDITFIATQDELRLFDSLNLEGKRNFQNDFWQKRDPNPTTAENEFKLEHYRRIKYCEEHFGQYRGVIKGWQTDMGRVYIMYGEQSEIERNQSSIEERNWQRWWYHGLEGGIYFIFVDFEDTGAFQLVHSSKQNEIKDYNWEDKVKMTLFQR